MKKILSGLVAGFLLLGMMAGCSNETEKTPKERLQAAMENSLEITAMEESLDLAFDVQVAENDPELDMILNMVNNAQISGQFALDQEKMNFQGSFTVDLDGMSYEMQLFFSPEKYVVKIPLIEQYLVMYDFTEEDMEQLFDAETMKELSNEMIEVIMAQINEENIFVMEETILDTPDGEVAVTPIQIEFRDEVFEQFIQDVVTKMFENEFFQEYLAENLKLQNEMLGLEMSDADVQQQIIDMQNELETAFTEMDGLLDDSYLKMISYLTGDNIEVGSDLDLMFSIPADEEIGQPEMTIGMKINSVVWNIDGEVDVTMPELTEENSMTMEEMMMNSFMPMEDATVEYGIPEETMLED